LSTVNKFSDLHLRLCIFGPKGAIQIRYYYYYYYYYTLLHEITQVTKNKITN